MKVLNVEPYGYSEIAIQQWIESGWQYYVSDWDKITEVQSDTLALIVRLKRKIGKAELDLFPNLRYLLTATTGLDHVDQSELTTRNIKLISLRGEDAFLRTIPSTAEHTWALCLSLIRQIPSSVNDVKKGGWNRDQFRGYQLKGKQLGLIGLGRTGLKVASYGEAFDMSVCYYDPYVTDLRYKRYEDLSQLLTHSDIISIHVHLSKETEKLLRKENISKIKNGAFLINTSRGKVWDEQALYEALAKEQIRGIAADVLATELEDIRVSPLWKAMSEEKHVVITPHTGGATWDAMWACEEFIQKKTLSSHNEC